MINGVGCTLEELCNKPFDIQIKTNVYFPFARLALFFVVLGFEISFSVLSLFLPPSSPLPEFYLNIISLTFLFSPWLSDQRYNKGQWGGEFTQENNIFIHFSLLPSWSVCESVFLYQVTILLFCIYPSPRKGEGAQANDFIWVLWMLPPNVIRCTNYKFVLSPKFFDVRFS